MISKHKPVRDKKYLEWLRIFSCVNCHQYKNEYEDIVPAHQTIPELKYISVKGTSIKEHDNWALPMHKTEHDVIEHMYGQKPKDRLTKIIDLNMEYLFNYNTKLYAKVVELMPQLNEVQVLEYITRNWKQVY